MPINPLKLCKFSFFQIHAPFGKRATHGNAENKINKWKEMIAQMKSSV